MLDRRVWKYMRIFLQVVAVSQNIFFSCSAVCNLWLHLYFCGKKRVTQLFFVRKNINYKKWSLVERFILFTSKNGSHRGNCDLIRSFCVCCQ